MPYQRLQVGEDVQLLKQAVLAGDSHISIALRENFPFIFLVALYAALSFLVSAIFGFPVRFNLYNAAIVYFVPFVLGLWFAGACIYELYKHRPLRPTKFLCIKIMGDWQVPRRLALGLPVIVIISPFMGIFTSMKSAISRIIPFYADPWMAYVDRVIHGDDAWQLIHPLLGHPYATTIVNFFYHLWLPVFVCTVIVLAFKIGNLHLRLQFLTAFALAWFLLGTIVAVLFASVGPCYYLVFFNENLFSELMTYLTRANEVSPVWALTAQSALLESYKSSDVGVGAGISAFPSLHVAIAVLLAILCWKMNRVLGLVGISFAIIIVIGSVHLGWHYAIDAYASIIAAPAIWWFAGKLCELNVEFWKRWLLC